MFDRFTGKPTHLSFGRNSLTQKVGQIHEDTNIFIIWDESFNTNKYDSFTREPTHLSFGRNSLTQKARHIHEETT